MTIRYRISWLLPLLLAACAGGQHPAQPVKEVATADQAQYWLVDSASLPAGMPAEDGCFRVAAIIGSDGRLHEPKVLASVGRRIAAWLPSFLAQIRFDPAPQNPGRVPIRTTFTWTLSQTVETSTVSAASAAAAVKAAQAAGLPPDTLATGEKCKLEMDRQMGMPGAQA